MWVSIVIAVIGLFGAVAGIIARRGKDRAEADLAVAQTYSQLIEDMRTQHAAEIAAVRADLAELRGELAVVRNLADGQARRITELEQDKARLTARVVELETEMAVLQAENAQLRAG